MAIDRAFLGAEDRDTEPGDAVDESLDPIFEEWRPGQPAVQHMPIGVVELQAGGASSELIAHRDVADSLLDEPGLQRRRVELRRIP